MISDFKMSDSINERIALLRDFMKEKNLQAFIVPSTDAHMSEYIPEYWNSREWISGFTGSQGTVVISMQKAGLWTDSRYFLQAEEELRGSEIVLFKDRLPETPKYQDWLAGELHENDRVGIDGNVYPAKLEFPFKGACQLIETFKKKKLSLVSEYDPFASIRVNRPALPEEKIFVLPEKYAGESARSKIERIRKENESQGADATFISTLDSIAWVFNIRGNDVPYNPVAVSYAFVSRSEAILFIDPAKVDEKARNYLEKEGVRILPYDKTKEYLSTLTSSVICIDSSKISYNFYRLLGKENLLIDTLSTVDHMKSIKNETEIEGFRNAMVKDGIALVKFYIWLEESVPKGIVTEYNIGTKLDELRAEQDLHRGESFPTIAAFGANAAMNHYHPTEKNCSKIKNEGFLLIDSGAQFLNGTTDITRTVALGKFSEEMKKDYTLVLKGNIDLATTVFPEGTRGSQIDIRARMAMWKQGVNFGHGTGHGVGHFLNVHEGPQSIRPEENPVTLQKGMVISNEPGIYRDFRYGVRTENLMLVRLEKETEFGKFYSFETLTLCPIDTLPVMKEMMSAEEIEWLNDYHRTVYEKLSPRLSDKEKDWLRIKTKKI